MRTPFYGCLLILILLSAASGYAADEETFRRIYQMKMAELTEATFDRLDEKYPDEDWESWHFPKYVFTSDSVEAGYRVAVKEPKLLSQIPCYCFCEAIGHTSLLDCFRSQEGDGRFDDHAVACDICYGQAMMAFLWREEGFAVERILRAFEKRFEPLAKPEGKEK